jgi:hypothetical protein
MTVQLLEEGFAGMEAAIMERLPLNVLPIVPEEELLHVIIMESVR